MIPKVIHYCWFGRNPKPKLMKKCIRSWKKHCRDYEIIEWNEDNYDIASAPLYVRQAYEAKKWAFVTDYVRLKVIYEHGGIYLDTDVEIKKSFSDLLSYNAFFGMQQSLFVATGLGFGAIKHSEIIHDMMEQYSNIPFILEDGRFDLLDCPTRNLPVFEKYGFSKKEAIQTLKGNIAIFPAEYFCPLDWETKKMNLTQNTYSIHWFSASWWGEQEKRYDKEKRKQERKDRRKRFQRKALIALFGEQRYNKIKEKLKSIFH